MIQKFRKKPVEYYACQFTGNNSSEIEQWSEGKVIASPVLEPTDDNPTGAYLQIETLEGTMTAIVSDWVIKGTKGEFYPCKPDIHKNIADPVEEKP